MLKSLEDVIPALGCKHDAIPQIKSPIRLLTDTVHIKVTNESVFQGKHLHIQK